MWMGIYWEVFYFHLKSNENFSRLSYEHWGEFNNASALKHSLYWCQALHIMNKDRYRSWSTRRALALLNSPLVVTVLSIRSIHLNMKVKYRKKIITGTDYIVCCSELNTKCLICILIDLSIKNSMLRSVEHGKKRFITSRTGHEVIKLFLCSTQLSTNFQLFIKTIYNACK